LGAAVSVTSSQASSSGILIEFNLNPSATGAFGTSTCNIFGDNVNLVIVYTVPSANGRRGQVIIGFERTPDGDFRMVKNPRSFVNSTQGSASDRGDSANSAIISKREE
jgi:hypothetical protein